MIKIVNVTGQIYRPDINWEFSPISSNCNIYGDVAKRIALTNAMHLHSPSVLSMSCSGKENGVHLEEFVGLLIYILSSWGLGSSGSMAPDLGSKISAGQLAVCQ